MKYRLILTFSDFIMLSYIIFFTLLTSQKNKVKIVNCCGFDSIPADLGVQSIVQEMDSKGLIPKQIRMILYDMKGRRRI